MCAGPGSAASQRGTDASRGPTAGTNFLTRSAAFAAAGWSPTYTLTEDYALGMELKKRRWQCRYVNEYLAVGEAPEQVRNCFQQRSRWAKGCAACVPSPPPTVIGSCFCGVSLRWPRCAATAL